MPEIRQLTNDEVQALATKASKMSGDSLRIDVNDLVSLCNEVLFIRTRMSGEKTLEIRSIVSLRNGLPYVTLTLGSTLVQITVQEAIQHATRILEVAAGSAADGFLVKFLREELHAEPAHATGLLSAFRAYRETTLGMLAPDDLPAPADEDA